MRAVILAGGVGTRLRPYTTVLPKPLVPVGERPILELILNQLHAAGFTRADLCVGHLGGLIRAYLSESGVVPDGLEVHYQWEEEPLGTAGALRLIDRPDDPFLVMNGDILTTLDYGDFLRGHSDGGAALTIATHRKDVPLALGVIESEGETVTGYVEKPTLHYNVSMGIYAYSPWALDHVPEGRFDFPDLVLKLLAEGERVDSHPFEGEWFDIGTRDEHEHAVSAFEADPERYEAE
ncbi:MAG: NDP-mannose synthase [Solirubrobacterales bacterium]|jgi:NDP-sugar pyrophosphorylase family protein|nr:NDP-mannose synthase [Solirubrobacterales bacterium]